MESLFLYRSEGEDFNGTWISDFRGISLIHGKVKIHRCTFRNKLSFPSVKVIRVISVGKEYSLKGNLYLRFWDLATSWIARAFSVPMHKLSRNNTHFIGIDSLPFAVRFPSSIPASVIKKVLLDGTWNIAEWRSSSILSGWNFCSFRNDRDKGRKWKRGSIASSKYFSVGIPVSRGKRDSTIDIGKRGGSLDSLARTYYIQSYIWSAG